MSSLKIWIATLLVLAAAVPARSDFDGSRPLLCSITKINECTPGGDCKETTLESVGLPQFLKVDVQHKTVIPAEPMEGRKATAIERVERIDGKLILQGAEDGVENVRDGLGWTAAISEATGKLILTASGEDVAFVSFGACIAQETISIK
jgi:hypothetical protein